MDKFGHSLDEMFTRLGTLERQAKTAAATSPELLEALTSLSTALEELTVMESEVKRQAALITEAYGQMEQAHQRYRDLFEFAPDGYLVTDPNGVILEANHVLAALLHRAPASLVGRIFLTFALLPERQSLRAHLYQVCQSQSQQYWEGPLARLV